MSKRQYSRSTSTSSEGTPSKKAHIRLTIAEKRDVICKLKAGSTVNNVALEYKIGVQIYFNKR